MCRAVLGRQLPGVPLSLPPCCHIPLDKAGICSLIGFGHEQSGVLLNLPPVIQPPSPCPVIHCCLLGVFPQRSAAFPFGCPDEMTNPFPAWEKIAIPPSPPPQTNTQELFCFEARFCPCLPSSLPHESQQWRWPQHDAPSPVRLMAFTGLSRGNQSPASHFSPLQESSSRSMGLPGPDCANTKSCTHGWVRWNSGPQPCFQKESAML